MGRDTSRVAVLQFIFCCGRVDQWKCSRSTQMKGAAETVWDARLETETKGREPMEGHCVCVFVRLRARVCVGAHVPAWRNEEQRKIIQADAQLHSACSNDTLFRADRGRPWQKCSQQGGTTFSHSKTCWPSHPLLFRPIWRAQQLQARLVCASQVYVYRWPSKISSENRAGHMRLQARYASAFKCWIMHFGSTSPFPLMAWLKCCRDFTQLCCTISHKHRSHPDNQVAPALAHVMQRSTALICSLDSWW